MAISIFFFLSIFQSLSAVFLFVLFTFSEVSIRISLFTLKLNCAGARDPLESVKTV